MSDVRVIPAPASTDLVTFTILLDGEQINGEYNVMNIAVQKQINKVANALITLADGDPANSEFLVSQSEDFLPGKEIDILAGYHSDETTIFKGIILSHGLKVRENRSSILQITCKDAAVKMTLGRKSAYYQDMTDSDILEEIIGDHGLESDVESMDVTHPSMVKYDTTDWDFMMIRAEVNGKLVQVDDGKVTLASPDLGQEPVLELLFGATMLEFEAEMDAFFQLPGVTSTAWDHANQEMITEDGEDPNVDPQGNVNGATLSDVIGLEEFIMPHTGKVMDQELKQWADSQLLKSRLARCIGRVRCQGFADVKPGTLINLDGVGDRFNGKVFVGGVRHQIAEENWSTDIQFGLNPEWFSAKKDIIRPSSGGLIPGMVGLQIGVVTALEGDPDGEDRIQVKLPVVDSEADGVWARVSSLDAGDKRGAYWMPEIEDEVIMGFLNGDPRYPIVLGMVHSSAKPSPITPSDNNHEKGVVTRSEMKMIFDDDLVSYKLETPNGNVIHISEDSGSILIEDENKNKLEMTSGGILLESPGNIDMIASGDVTINGVNVNLKANASLVAEGASGADFKSDAMVTIKGSVTKIN
jgi:Rhs element Vgr protein